MKKLLFILLLLPSIVWSQGSKFGVRAGVDFSKFLGTLEEGEAYNFSNGFHFGINYTYYVTDYFGFGGEVIYQQKGTKRSFNGDGFYPIHKPGEDNYTFVDGNLDMSIDISNAYVSLPLTVSLKPFSKLEWFAGVSPNFLILPIGAGAQTFVSRDDPDRLFFDQTLTYQYYEDENEDFLPSTFNPAVYCGDDVVNIQGTAGAYYHFDAAAAQEKMFKWFDLTALTGLNFYYNKSLYLGARVEYGLIDLTNQKVDYSLAERNGNSFIFRNDKDVHFGIQASIGFKF